MMLRSSGKNQNSVFMKYFEKEPKVQGIDSIIINAPISRLWPLIQDSKAMESWGPPVKKIEIELLPEQTVEGVGSKRIVYAKFSEKRQGWYNEVRTEQLENKSVTFRINEDSFGMSKMLSDIGAKMELHEINKDKTEFIFTFFHRPINFFGWVMNPMIKMDQKKNRLKALKSLKSFAETGKAIKN
jgi:hypothetical protein